MEKKEMKYFDIARSVSRLILMIMLVLGLMKINSLEKAIQERDMKLARIEMTIQIYEEMANEGMSVKKESMNKTLATILESE